MEHHDRVGPRAVQSQLHRNVFPARTRRRDALFQFGYAELDRFRVLPRSLFDYCPLLLGELDPDLLLAVGHAASHGLGVTVVLITKTRLISEA